MIVLLAAFLSIALGIVNILLGQVIIIGQGSESFKALYAADLGIERTLYLDLINDACGVGGCNTIGSGCGWPSPPDNNFVDITSGACYKAVVKVGPIASCPAPNTRCIDVTGQYGDTSRFVQRRFTAAY